MENIYSSIKKIKQAGFTLLELLLVIGVGSVLLLGITQVTDNWVKYLKSEQAGEHMEMVRRSVDNYLHSTDPRDLEALIPTVPGGNIFDITNNPAFQNFLPSGAGSLRNPLGRRVNVRIARNNTVPTQTFYEAYIYTTGEPIMNKMLLSAANAIGAYGGIVARIKTPAAPLAQVESLFGTWSLNAVQQSAIGLDMNPASAEVTQDGGQLFVYYSVSPQEVPSGVYLYRVNIGDPIFNTMEADLYMNGNNIVNAGNITASNIESTGAVSIGGQLTAGSAEITGNLVTGTMQVDGTATINGNLTMNGADNTVDGTLTAAGINTQSVEAGDIKTNNIGAANMDVKNTLNAGALTASNVDNLTVTGTVEADSVSVASNLNVTNGISTGSMKVIGGTVTVQGDVNLQGDMVTENMAVNNKLSIGASCYGNCP